jgi:hypothetical protein
MMVLSPSWIAAREVRLGFSCAVAGIGMLITVDRSFARMSVVSCDGVAFGCDRRLEVAFVWKSLLVAFVSRGLLAAPYTV